MNYKDVFAFKASIINEDLIKSDPFDSFRLNNYEEYSSKLDEEFYLRYFIYQYLFVIDEMDLDEFLEYHFQNSNSSEKFLKILVRKIIPQIQNIIENAQPNLGVAGNPAGVHLGDGFYKSGNQIFKHQYDIFKMSSFIGGKSFTSKYKLKLEIMFQFVEVNKKNENISKLIWKGGPAQMGVIFGELVQKGYIEADYFRGNINYAKMSRELQNVFAMEKSKSSKSLEMYLNPDNEKNQQANRSFKDLGFSIPDLLHTK